jgi:hypothetical protein
MWRAWESMGCCWMMKRSDERGLPCGPPLSMGKGSVGAPLTRTRPTVPFRKSWAQRRAPTPKRMASITRRVQARSMKSKALAKSRNNMVPSVLVAVRRSMRSLWLRMLSPIQRPGRKPVWAVSMAGEMAVATRVAMARAAILTSALMPAMGRRLPGSRESPLLGTRV